MGKIDLMYLITKYDLELYKKLHLNTFIIYAFYIITLKV